MQPLIIQPTANTPRINFDKYSGILEISGRSTPENPSEYYSAALRWVDQYIQHPSEQTTIRTFFEYFNTSSSKCILEIMKRIRVLQQDGKHVHWEWLYETEDEDMKEAGSDFSDLLKVPFQIRPKS
jgi:hypothetical protein